MAFTRSGGTVAVYVDGERVGSSSTGGGAARLAHDFSIGRIQTGGNYFAGELAEIRIYDGDLTADDVTAVSAQMASTYRTTGSDYSQAVLDSGPAHYYRLGEASNAIPANDEVGTNHGTYLGGPAVGRPGAEWVVRHRSAPRRQDGPGISCIDLFDGDLVPGLQIAAVLGTFEPGARCQPHRHEVDKSVIAVQGTALCTVEGRKHPLAAGAAALVPSGRLHCIANQTVEAAAAIWVCAGPSAAPTVPDDGTAATAGDDTP